MMQKTRIGDNSLHEEHRSKDSDHRSKSERNLDYARSAVIIIFLGSTLTGIASVDGGIIESLSVGAEELVLGLGLDGLLVEQGAGVELLGINSVINELLAESLGESVGNGDAVEGVGVSAALRTGVLLHVGGDLDVANLGHDLLERLELADDVRVAVVLEFDNAVLVLLERVLVDETTRENTSHVLRVESSGLLPLAGTDINAAVLGKEDGERVVLKVLDELVVAGALEGVGAAPLVRVDTKEIDVALVAALHPPGERDAELNVVGVGVADGDLALEVLLGVGLHVAGDGLDVVGGVLLDC